MPGRADVRTAVGSALDCERFSGPVIPTCHVGHD